MKFSPKRLSLVRKNLGISKAEAARRLNMSAMGYGRYENGDRTPSYQTIVFMAQILGTNPGYLCGESDSPKATDYVVSFDNLELYQIIETIKDESPENLKRILDYVKKMH